MERQFGGGIMLLIDAGHGGFDPGAVGTKLKEKDFTLKLAKYLEAYLKSKGAPCALIRSNDDRWPLEQRVDVANKSSATHFISLHINAAANQTANGVEVYASSKGGEKETFANVMQRALVSSTGFTDRGVKFSPFYVLRNTKQVAILVELGFITNASDQEKLISEAFLKSAAETMGEAYLKHIGFKEKQKERWEVIIEGMDPRWHGEIIKIKSEGGLRRYISDLIEKVYDSGTKN